MVFSKIRQSGSGIFPENTPPKFFARHFTAYHFALSYIRGKDVLEIGFGEGYGADFLSGHVKSIKAVDILTSNVERASSKYKKPNLTFNQMDAKDVSFSDESFDAVLSFQVIEHIEIDGLKMYLEGIKRVLRKNGTAFISTLNLDTNKKLKRPYKKNPSHIKEFNYKEFIALVGEVFDSYDARGLFYGRRLKFYERLKKTGMFRFLPGPLNIVNRFYDNITVNEFTWKKKDIEGSVDFMAICRKP